MGKPKKPSKYMKNRRGIYLMDPPAKAYGTWVQRRITENRRGKWHNHAFGAIQKRGTAQALTKVMSTIELLRARKRSFFI
jgi:hypothetical protein